MATKIWGLKVQICKKKYTAKFLGEFEFAAKNT
jgi:hypothetical protein